MDAEPRGETVDEEEAEAYEQDDPKHPEYHSTRADIWDMRDKTEEG